MAKMDRIYKAAPVDLVAARVTWAGVHYEPDKKLNQEIWTEGPPPTIDPPGNEDLRGTTRGKLTIVGYLEPKKLLGRCVCGNYEMRNAKAWRKGIKEDTPDLGCQFCRHLHHLKNTDHYRRHGFDLKNP
jgi:hypothetical protein